MPDSFPADEYTQFRQAAREVLTNPAKGDAWREFAGASNLIGWRFRAAADDWQAYKDSWKQHGANVDHDGIYQRDRLLFGMFSAGVSCLDSTAYALAALASHPKIAGLTFGTAEQRQCKPKWVADRLAHEPKAANLVTVLNALNSAEEWRQWVDYRNRLTHRSNLPQVIIGAVGAPLPPAHQLHFAATSSSPAIKGDMSEFDKLHAWLAMTLRALLVEGGRLAA